jgi:hypothetical protein
MKVEMDAAVAEFTYLSLHSVFSKPHAKVGFSQLPDDEAETALMFILGDLVACGGAEHRYEKNRNVDEFVCTDRLRRNWGWLFPNGAFPKSCSPHLVFKLSGKRSKYINDRWLRPDPENPAPIWPY